MNALEHISMTGCDAGSAGQLSLEHMQIQEDVMEQLQRGRRQYEPFSQEDVDQQLEHQKTPEERAREEKQKQMREVIRKHAPSLEEETGEIHGSITPDELEQVLKGQ